MIRFVDTEGKVLYASPSHKTVIGLEPEDVVGISAFDTTVFLVVPIVVYNLFDIIVVVQQETIYLLDPVPERQ